VLTIDLQTPGTCFFVFFFFFFFFFFFCFLLVSQCARVTEARRWATIISGTYRRALR